MRDIDQLLSTLEAEQPAPDDFDDTDVSMAAEWLALASSLEADKLKIRRQVAAPGRFRSRFHRRFWQIAAAMVAALLCGSSLVFALLFMEADGNIEGESLVVTRNLMITTNDSLELELDVTDRTQIAVLDVTRTALVAEVFGTATAIATQESQSEIGENGATAIASDFQSELEAGEINDNDDFETYLDYRSAYLQSASAYSVHDIDVSERHVIHVLTPNNQPVLGADVIVFDENQNVVAELRTTASGTVHFFPNAYAPNSGDFIVQVSKNETVESLSLSRANGSGTWKVELDVAASKPPINLDVLFLIDSTGSMRDEIDELKANMLSISSQIDQLPAAPDVRYGLVTYRDRNDVYVTQIHDFTSSVTEFQATLAQLQARDGGDNSESVNQGLHEAIHDVEWRDADTVKIILLVGDAPPHLDYANDFDYAEEIRIAAERGIKIHTIASSGLNDSGEFIFRQIAQFTGGNFIFLAYEDEPQSPSSNEPGEPGTSHHVPETAYTVEYLDSLVVRLIEAELMWLVEPENLQQ